MISLPPEPRLCQVFIGFQHWGWALLFVLSASLTIGRIFRKMIGQKRVQSSFVPPLTPPIPPPFSKTHGVEPRLRKEERRTFRGEGALLRMLGTSGRKETSFSASREPLRMHPELGFLACHLSSTSCLPEPRPWLSPGLRFSVLFIARLLCVKHCQHP